MSPRGVIVVDAVPPVPTGIVGRCPEPRTAERCAAWAWHMLSQPCPPGVLRLAALDLARAIERGDALPKMIRGADPMADPLPAKPARPRRGTVAP